MQSVNFRFHPGDLATINELADHWKLNRTQTIRRAVHEARERVGLERDADAAFIARLKHDLTKRYGKSASLEVHFDDDLNLQVEVGFLRYESPDDSILIADEPVQGPGGEFPVATSESAEGIPVETRTVKMSDGEGYEQPCERVYLTDPDSSFRLLLGLLPHDPRLGLHVWVHHLDVDMFPATAIGIDWRPDPSAEDGIATHVLKGPEGGAFASHEDESVRGGNNND